MGIESRERIWVIGKNGFIAKQIIGSRWIESYDVLLTSSKKDKDSHLLDFEQNIHGEFDFGVIQENDYVLLLASISSPDVCRTNFEHAYNVNVVNTGIFIEEALKKRARVIFFSSDAVFGGTETDCYEDSPMCPATEYGRMKADIENTYQGASSFKVLRLSYVLSLHDKFSQYLYSTCERQTVAEVYHPLFRSVVNISDVMRFIRFLLEFWSTEKNHVFNVCGPELISRLDIANLFRKQVNSALRFNTIDPGSDFLLSRSQLISMKSNYTSVMFGEKPQTISYF